MNNFKYILENSGFVYFLLFLLTLVYLAFVEYLFPNSFLTSDNATYYLPSYVHNFRSVFEYNTIPLINFHQYLGTTHLAQGQTGVLYPPVYIAGLLSQILFEDYLHTMIILGFLHYYASGVGMFLLLKRFKVETFLAFISIIMWITFPYFIFVGRGWIFVLYTIAYLPFNFLFLDKLLDKPKFKYAIILSVLKALFFFQGYVQYVFMLIFLEFIYFLIYIRINGFNSGIIDTPSSIWKKVYENRKLISQFKYYLISILLFTGLSAPLLFPMIEAQRESHYRALRVPIGDFLEHYLTFVQFVKTQFFNFDIIGAFWVTNEIFFIGIINLLILIFSIYSSIKGKLKNIKQIYIFQILAVFTFLLSSRFYIIFYPVPFFNFFRWPFKYFLFFLFFCFLSVVLFLNKKLVADKTKSNNYIFFMLFLCILFNLYAFYQDSDSVMDKFSLHKESSYLDRFVSEDEGRIFSYALTDNNYAGYANYYTHNYATLYNKYHIAGYDPLRSELINRLALGLDLSVPRRNITLNKQELEYLDNWSVKYLLLYKSGGARSKEFVSSKYKLSFENSRIFLLESSKSVPYIFYFSGGNEDFNKGHFINNYKRKNIKYEFGINEIQIFPEINEIERLVVNVAPLKWYKFFINGEDKGFIENGTIRPVIKIDSDTKTVKLKYVNYYYYLGWLFFVSVLAMITCLLIFEYIFSRKIET